MTLSKNSTLRCIDAIGRVQTVSVANGLVDVSMLPSGYYTLVHETNDNVQRAAFVKQ